MNIEIANRLVKLRKEKALSQETLAEKLGISRQAVSKWERAEASPDTDNLIALAKLYQISLDELLCLEDNASSTEEEKTDFQHFNGIHLKSNDGELYIGRNVLYASDADDVKKPSEEVSVHIVVDGKTYTFAEARKKWSHHHHGHRYHFSILMTVVILYLTLGASYNAWHPTWLLFLLVPILCGTTSAIAEKNWRLFPYPIFIVSIYLALGFSYHLWHSAWVLFLTVPLYCHLRKMKNDPNGQNKSAAQ